MIHVTPGDRVLVIGQTGSGKSAFANEIARRWPRFLVFDPSHLEEQLPGSVMAYGVDEALRAIPGRVHYRPLPAEFDDLAGHFDRLAARVRSTGGAQGILIHELAIIAPQTGARRHLKYLIVAGRKHRIPMLLCTQRPRWIDGFARSQATHLVVFRVDDLDDQAEVRKMLALPRRATLDKPPFAFHHRGPDSITRLLPPVPLSS